MIGPWLVEQARRQIAERNSQVMSKGERPAVQGLPLTKLMTERSCEVIKGYARVSTDGQDLATQHELLKAAGAELVYSEKQSGVNTDRAALARCMRLAGAGGHCRSDEARSPRPLNSRPTQHSSDNRRAGASFKSLGDPWADTTTPHGRLMLTVLGGLAEFERHLILSRTNEGRVRAKARGVRFGGSASSRSISRPKHWRGLRRAKR